MWKKSSINFDPVVPTGKTVSGFGKALKDLEPVFVEEIKHYL